jgi:hypothetical protein
LTTHEREWRNPVSELRDRDDIPLLLEVKKLFKLVWVESTFPMQLTDWLLVEVALLLIGLTQISFVKNWF